MQLLWIALAVVGVLVVLLLLLFAVRSYQAQHAVPDLGLDDANRFKPCPASPNCVSSQAADEAHAMDSWKIDSSLTAVQLSTALREACAKVGNVRWRTERGSDTYLHGVFRSSVFRFPDDVEFFIDKDNSVIHFRSASRVGYSDLGANRKRMESIKKKLDKIAENRTSSQNPAPARG